MYEFAGGLAVIIGLIIMIIGIHATGIRVSLSGFLIAIIGIIFFVHPAWGTGLLFLQNAVAAVPFLVWVVVGVTAYFTLNHIYATWLRYAQTHPEIKNFAAKILTPWPLNPEVLPDASSTNDRIMLQLIGVIFFCGLWIIATISYAAWLIFGGGIAKLLHLVPRE